MNYYIIYDVLYPLLSINVCLGYHLLLIVNSSGLNSQSILKHKSVKKKGSLEKSHTKNKCACPAPTA